MIGSVGVVGARLKTPAPARNLNQTIEAAARNLLSSRKEDGHWRFELEGDTILESEYVLLLYFLGRADDPRITACCRRLRSQQMPTGGWATWAHRPSMPLGVTLDELETEFAPTRARRPLIELLWAQAFSALSALFKLVEWIGPPWWRRRALVKAERWLTERIECADGLGAIFGAMVNVVIALRCLGHDLNHPLVQAQLRELERFEIEEAGETRRG